MKPKVKRKQKKIVVLFHDRVWAYWSIMSILNELDHTSRKKLVRSLQWIVDNGLWTIKNKPRKNVKL